MTPSPFFSILYAQMTFSDWLKRKIKAICTLFPFHDLKSWVFTSVKCMWSSSLTCHVTHEQAHVCQASYTFSIPHSGEMGSPTYPGDLGKNVTHTRAVICHLFPGNSMLFTNAISHTVPLSFNST